MSGAPDRAIGLFQAIARHHGEAWAYDNSPRFGSNALRIDGKIYVALTRKHWLLAKLSPTRTQELLATGRAEPMTSGGRTMQGWITLAPKARAEWLAIADEARVFAFASRKQKTGLRLR